MLSSIRERHGRLQGLVHHWTASAALAVGRLEPFRRSSTAGINRLVFVCSGNICRSPFAEAVARARGIRSVSMGLRADPGKPAWGPIKELATDRGFDLDSHRATRFEPGLLAADDLVIAFEPVHAREIASGLGSVAVPVALLGLWNRRPIPHIEDPYGLGRAYQVRCLVVIEAAVDEIARHWQSPG